MRRELKYLVRESERQGLIGALAPFLRPDPHAAAPGPDAPAPSGPGYWVRSVYHDTPGLRDWSDKASGDEIRRKTRVRAYGAPGESPVFLEVKRKNNAGVWKDRAAVTPEQARALLAGAAPGALARPLAPGARAAAERFLYRLRAEHRRPVLLVTYWREPLVGRFDPSLRVTLDRALRVRAHPGGALEALWAERQRPLHRGRFILEVKFDRAYPSWLRPLVGRLGLRQQALSKYAMGMELEAARAPWRFGRPAVGALAR